MSPWIVLKQNMLKIWKTIVKETPSTTQVIPKMLSEIFKFQDYLEPYSLKQYSS